MPTLVGSNKIDPVIIISIKTRVLLHIQLQRVCRQINIWQSAKLAYYYYILQYNVLHRNKCETNGNELDTQSTPEALILSIFAKSHSLLHKGQAYLVFIHFWMQSKWNTWPHVPQAMLRPGWAGSPTGGGQNWRFHTYLK